MNIVEQKKTDLEAQLADPEVYEGPTQVLQELQIKVGNIKSGLTKAEDAWLKVQAKIESTKIDHP